jgi:putative PIN family toxin of toxin-antitoxin system
LSIVTLDSNIYVSALNFKGRPLQLLQNAAAGEIEVAVSDAIIDEVTRILRDKFGWSEDRVQGAESTIRSIARHVTPRKALDVVKNDPDDNRIVECAQASGSEFIVTGDNDLLRIGEYEGMKSFA